MKRPLMTTMAVARRIKNFQEVNLGLTKKQAMDEAHRCPQCAHPQCVQGCPLGIDIPGFIRSIREGDFICALQKIREQNSLAGICGRLCSAPCEQACFLNQEQGAQPISIRDLERFAFDHGQSKMRQIFNAQSSHVTNQKIAVVGSGAAGLFLAAQLREDGHEVTIFEAFENAGGFLHYGIPEFRLPKKVLQEEIEYIQSLGIDIQTHCAIGQAKDLEDLFAQGYHKIVLATGASVFEKQNLKGEDSVGVYAIQEVLMRLSFGSVSLRPQNISAFLPGTKAVILGSHETALDCARILTRLGKKSVIVHASTQEEFNAPLEQQRQAWDEGVELESLVRPIDIVTDQQDNVQGLQCLRLDFAATEQEGKWKLLAVKNSEFTIEAQTVILAGSSQASSYLAKCVEDLKLDKQRCFYRKNGVETSVQHVFAVGACALGPKSLIEVLEDSQKVSEKISSLMESKIEKVNGSTDTK